MKNILFFLVLFLLFWYLATNLMARSKHPEWTETQLGLRMFKSMVLDFD